MTFMEEKMKYVYHKFAVISLFTRAFVVIGNLNVVAIRFNNLFFFFRNVKAQKQIDLFLIVLVAS